MRGVTIPDPTGIVEAYAIVKRDESGFALRVNVSAERISETFRRLAACLPDPGFFIVEVPSHRDTEARLRKSKTDPTHVDVFFRDDLPWADAAQLFSRFEDLLVHDGMVSFGFGSHQGGEVFVGGYKLFTLYTKDPSTFVPTLSELGFPRFEQLRTVWDTFSQTGPGNRSCLRDAPMSIYQMIEVLQREEGFYFHGHRPG